jgi:uncharacterized metal-binding protein YceD (DUF177 family)
MKVHLCQISEDGLQLTGEESSDLIGAGEFTPGGPIQYDVLATRQSDGALLVQGTLSAEGTMRCVRCLSPLPTSLHVPDFTVFVEKPEGECVDLTEQVREDMLLSLPVHAKCTLDAERRCPVTGERFDALDPTTEPEPLGDRWEALERLKPKK